MVIFSAFSFGNIFWKIQINRKTVFILTYWNETDFLADLIETGMPDLKSSAPNSAKIDTP